TCSVTTSIPASSSRVGSAVSRSRAAGPIALNWNSPGNWKPCSGLSERISIPRLWERRPGNPRGPVAASRDFLRFMGERGLQVQALHPYVAETHHEANLVARPLPRRPRRRPVAAAGAVADPAGRHPDLLAQPRHAGRAGAGEQLVERAPARCAVVAHQ